MKRTRPISDLGRESRLWENPIPRTRPLYLRPTPILKFEKERKKT